MNMIQEVKKIEQEARELEEMYDRKIVEMEENTDSKIAEMKNDIEEAIEGYKHEQEAEKVEIENYAKEFAGKRLLLVEDNQFNMDIAKELLTEADFLVDTAEDGTIAVDKVKYHEPLYYDVILMDIQMPIMNGYEATKQIRSMDDMRANIPIIALTADAFMEDRQKAIDCGMNGHMSKPIEIDNLFKTLHEVLINSENNIIADSNDREKDIKD